MKKIINKIEIMELSTREYLLVGVILFLVGLVAGMVVSPKGDRTYGSNNGNNNGNNNTGCITDDTKGTCGK